MEATMQSHALLPLLGACTASYLVSFFFMENTIMTEKIARRGIYTPDSYEPDILRKLTVAQVIKDESIVISALNTIKEVREFFETAHQPESHFIVVDEQGSFEGTVALTDIYNKQLNEESAISSIVRQGVLSVRSNDNLGRAVELMSEGNEELVPVLSAKENTVIGVLTYKDILTAYKLNLRENQEAGINLSLKRQRIKILIKGRKLANMRRDS
jgi:predicted transcriptional regulator